VLDGYARQDVPAGTFELLVVGDHAEPEIERVRAVVGDRPYPVGLLRGSIAGASASRNTGWRAAAAPIVLFTDSDTIPDRRLVSEHLEWHRRFPAIEAAVVGLVRWARGLKATPFMKWLELGIQFDFISISGIEASWAHLYSANSSMKRGLLELVGGYDEERLPYGYEDLDLAYRAREHGLRVMFNRRAIVDHWRVMTLEHWKARAPRLAATEWEFCRLHPEVQPWFWRLMSEAAALPPQRGRATRAARFVPRRVPWLGPLVWNLADIYWRQQIAPHFLAAWNSVATGNAPAVAPAVSARAERAPEASGPASP
jgi:cellulose synthase/poly-beta-1,6-N-acetylglucosamine synthase-like glycosyltransferase